MNFSTQGLLFGVHNSKRHRHLLIGALTIFSVLITLVQPITTSVAALTCPGGGTTALLDTAVGGATLKSVTGSTALDRSSPANLVANGDFTTEPAALASSAQPNWYYWANNGVTYLAQKNIQATLELGTNVINVSKGNTLNITPGDAVTEVATVGGKLNTSPVFVGSINSSTQFTVVNAAGAAANHSAAGFIVMSPIFLLDKSINTPVPGWNASGGGSASYPTWVRSSEVMTAIKLYPPLSNGQSQGRVYLGNKFVTSFSPALNFNAAGYSMATYTFVHDAIWGGNASPIAIDQNITTVVGTTYRMHFTQGGEDGRYPFANWVEADGIAAVDISGFKRVFFKVSPANADYYLEFVATSTTTNIKFMSWGHVTYDRPGYTTVPGTELALDDVIVNVCTSGPPPAPTAVNDAQSSAWDTDQTYTPLTNDSADVSTSLNTASLKLCPVDAISPYNSSNCSLTSVTVTGQGVYTISGSNVIFDPDATFHGVVSTPVRYVIADQFTQYASAIITPTIGPKATPDTLSLNPGATASFRTITGASGLATGAALNTAANFLCGTGETAPNCSATTVTVTGVGVYTLNQSTGVVTLVADSGATAGAKASLTYVVTDSTGLKASSTLTPTIIVPTPLPVAVNDAQSSAWDTDQTYTPLTNDSADVSTSLNTASLKLCPVDAISPYNSSNCSLTSVTVTGQGVYTLSGTTVTFNPDSTFFGVATPIRYVVADSLGQYANATITPTIGPKATPDTLTLTAGATASFRTITGASGLATGASLNTAATFLCGTGESAPNCTATTVTVTGVGVYTLNQSTGVVTLVAAANATPGVKAAITYVVTDSTGLKASSTLTPTIAVPTPLPVAVNDAQSSAWDTNQTYSPLSNDTADASTTLNTASLKLCPVGATSPYNASNCSAASVTVTGQGVYTLSGTTVTFNPDATFFGVATPIRYVVADALGQYANATITPTIGPKATPDTLSLAAGATASFKTITGSNGIATGASLNILATYLCGSNQTAPNCTETATVTVAGVGVYTLNQTTGIVTLVAAANATPGTKASLTYVVTDSTGMTASSTLTPTIPTPLPIAVNDAQSSAWDTNQIYSPMSNDSSDTSTALTAINFKLCPTGATSPFNATNCSLTTLTVAGQGVYTLSGTTVTFNPDATFFGVATPIRYVVSDGVGQFASATITPTIGPKATPDTLSLAAGATASFRTITGSNGIATGAALNTLATYLCGTNQIAPNCTETATVTVAGVGVYTLNQATGVVTLVADANATPGTKASLTYVVTDSTGMTASSTLTPTIPAPLVPPAPTPTPVVPAPAPEPTPPAPTPVAPTPVPEPTPPPLSVASPDTTSDFKGKVHSINLLTNDKPGTGLTLDALTLKFCALTETVPNCTATSVTITGQGTYAVGVGGVVTFTPEVNFVGTATALPYVVKDSYGRTINSTYTPTVRDVPSASPDNSSGPFQQVQTLSILGNDKASAGSTLVAGTVRLCALTETPPNCTASSVSIENQGVFLLGADGVVTFTPTKTFTGTATTIKYQVADTSGQIASSTITVIVGPAPLPPKAIDDFRTTPMNVAVSLDPTPNDIAGTYPLVAKTVRLCTASEAIGKCTSTSVTNATGTFTVNTATGVVTFTPKAGWTGVTKVPYIVVDTFGLIAPAYITVTIKPPAYLKLKELAWTGATIIGPSKKKLAIPASSAGTGARIATMRIPRLGSNWRQSVVNGISESNLKKDLGYYPGSALPGAIGNFAVAGHRMTQEQPFRDLDKLVAGDPIVVQVGKKIYVYTVVKSKIAKPTDIREIYPVPGNSNAIATKAMLTLTTCHPKNSAKERLVVNAVLDSVYDLETAPEKYKAKS